MPSNFGKGYGSNLVSEFKARKATQNRNIGLPSGPFFGTRMAGADEVELLSIITLLLSIFSIWDFTSSGSREVGTGVS